MSSAWNADGDVTKIYRTPWGAMRKGFITYKNVISTLTKLTLNGISYDFQKQAKEGLVVCGKGYESVTFFLPEDKKTMTSEDGNNMTINSYFEMLATTDYAVITAWDYFAQYLSNLVATTSYANTEFPYTITSMKDANLVLSGAAVLGNITSAKEFFGRLYNTSSQNGAPLSSWMEDDGTVSCVLVLGEGDSNLSFDLYVGRK